MNKISLIIKREYLTRVRKRSFLIMTVLGPVLMAALFIVPVYIAQIEGEVKTIGIVDESGLFENIFTDTETIRFIPLNTDLETAKKILSDQGHYAILYIPAMSITIPQAAKLYSSKQPNIIIKSTISETMRKRVESLKLEASGISPQILESIKSSISLVTIKINETGDEETSSTELSMAVGFVSGLLIYIFIFMYGALVMRGVIEEKTNRIVEVIVSSVKPFQLMMGKIVGVAMVGLTQFILWVVLTLILVTTVLSFYSQDIYEIQKEGLNIEQQIESSGFKTGLEGIESAGNEKGNETLVNLLDSIQSIRFAQILSLFLFYFIGGYLLYGALFAAIGAAVDSETDTQQFMLPLTVPLILSIVVAQFIMYNPEGPAAFWLSIFPLTSPVVMMIRLPFGVPVMQIYLSMALLILGFLGTTWLASKIYRTGILMYGKKISYRELLKWLKY